MFSLAEYFLGIDGGGSKTTAVVFDESGRFIKKAVGESINYYSVGMENARKNMAAIMDELSFEAYESAFIGMSALNGRADAQTTERFASGVINAKTVTMDSDLYIALEAMACEGECAVVISGTGSMAVLRKANGEIAHAGGWGYILGDEGSGYVIGLDGIKAAIRSAEGFEPTELLPCCLEHFGINDIYALIDLYYDSGVERKITAAFAKCVFECSEKGDETAQKIIDKQAYELAMTAQKLIRQAEGCPVGLWGGIFQHNEIFRVKFASYLDSRGEVSLLELAPEQGAVIAALRSAKINITNEIKTNINETYKAK